MQGFFFPEFFSRTHQKFKLYNRKIFPSNLCYSWNNKFWCASGAEPACAQPELSNALNFRRHISYHSVLFLSGINVFFYLILELGNIPSIKPKGFKGNLNFINCNILEIMLCNQGIGIIIILSSYGLSLPYYYFLKGRYTYIVILSSIPQTKDNYIQN